MAMIDQKYTVLQDNIRRMGRVMIAFSGGVDSTFLLKVCVDVLGDNVLAVTGDSESYARSELAETIALARQIGARHRVIRTHELDNPNYSSNTAQRCFFCKTELYTLLTKLAEEEGIFYICDGTNLDDVGDFRPGIRATQEHGVCSPLREAGLTKAEIRILSARLGLPTADKPAMACLSSRIPYGQQVTPKALGQIEAAEAFLHTLGVRQVRVRHHKEIARIEVDQEGFDCLVQPKNRARIVKALRELGYLYVTLDLAGYQSGSLNRVLKKEPETQQVVT